MTSQKELKAEARKYLSLSDLFPKGPPDFRKKLNSYQARKIRKAIETVKNIGGAYAHEIVPMGRGRKKYLDGAGLPVYMRGIFLPGGPKVNTGLKFVAGAVEYKRQGDSRRRFELHTHGDENDLISSAKQILKNKKRNERSAITANGRVIGSAQNLSNDATISQAVYIFNKYSELYENGEKRTRTIKGQSFECDAAHPSTWSMGILFEVRKNGEKKKATKGRKR